MRIQRFKVGDEVVVAAHAPMLEPGTHLIVYSVTDDLRPDFLTGGKPLTAGYYLHRPEAPRDRSVPLHLLWDWMLDPVESPTFTEAELARLRNLDIRAVI